MPEAFFDRIQDFPGGDVPPSPHHKGFCWATSVAGIHNSYPSYLFSELTHSQLPLWCMALPPSLTQTRAVASPSRWLNHVLSSWWPQHVRTSCKEGMGGGIHEVPIMNIHPGKHQH